VSFSNKRLATETIPAACTYANQLYKPVVKEQRPTRDRTAEKILLAMFYIFQIVKDDDDVKVRHQEPEIYKKYKKSQMTRKKKLYSPAKRQDMMQSSYYIRGFFTSRRCSAVIEKCRHLTSSLLTAAAVQNMSRRHSTWSPSFISIDRRRYSNKPTQQCA
jgi:hypothetical protein